LNTETIANAKKCRVWRNVRVEEILNSSRKLCYLNEFRSRVSNGGIAEVMFEDLSADSDWIGGGVVEVENKGSHLIPMLFKVCQRLRLEDIL